MCVSNVYQIEEVEAGPDKVTRQRNENVPFSSYKHKPKKRRVIKGLPFLKNLREEFNDLSEKEESDYKTNIDGHGPEVDKDVIWDRQGQGLFQMKLWYSGFETLLMSTAAERDAQALDFRLGV